ncbi:hypothetical protein LKI_01860 [Leuconostoc kimchii IMSNU 11154]|uniref:Uncharacterized protein n=1 Tax=Leuconostoc kimchii (strain IMSNU 11154 / KCTC 2386 / IH25) TaxID=762051 RepID=D5T0W6_LEUKI|nr:hypothetical protein [Leuconostoc kimchii]ADG39915.1 hypothetical protein LKI_01860 [Leuconostoc kimchii IMSNU 11154]
MKLEDYLDDSENSYRQTAKQRGQYKQAFDKRTVQQRQMRYQRNSKIRKLIKEDNVLELDLIAKHCNVSLSTIKRSLSEIGFHYRNGEVVK